MHLEDLIENISKELEASLKAMSKAKTTEEKVAYSQIVKNLSESLGMFLDLAFGMNDCCSEE